MAGLDKLIEDALRAEIRAAVARVLATMGAATDDAPPPAGAGGGDSGRGGRAVLAAVRGPRAPRRRSGGARLATGERHHGRTVLRAAGRRETGERRYRVRCDGCGFEGVFSRSAILRYGCRACAGRRRTDQATPAEAAAVSGAAGEILARMANALPVEVRVDGSAEATVARAAELWAYHRAHGLDAARRATGRGAVDAGEPSSEDAALAAALGRVVDAAPGGAVTLTATALAARLAGAGCPGLSPVQLGRRLQRLEARRPAGLVVLQTNGLGSRQNERGWRVERPRS